MKQMRSEPRREVSLHRPARRSFLATGMALLGGAAFGQAASYPTRPITIIVPYAPGGSPDVIARNLAQRLGPILNTTVLIDNRSGAAGTIGGQVVAKSKPDGYTLLLGTDTAVLTGAMSGLSYDGLRDLAPVGLISTSPVCIAAGPGMPAKSLKELVDLVRANPGKYEFASSGVGGIAHLIGEMLKRDAKLDLIHVPYRGSAQAVQDVVAGRVPLIITSPLPVMAQPTIRILGVFSDQRAPSLPDVPTAAEIGVPVKASVFSGLFVPTGTPEAVVATLQKAVTTVVGDPEFASAMLKLGQTPSSDTSPAYATKVAKEMNTAMIALFKSLNLTAQ